VTDQPNRYEQARERARPTPTCDASPDPATGLGTTLIGPCVLRHGHDGPVHRSTDGTMWAPRTEPAAPEQRCGNECSEGHTYEPPCEQAPLPGTCVWPGCLTDGQQTELAAQAGAAWGGKPTAPMPDQRRVCGCREAAPEQRRPETGPVDPTTTRVFAALYRSAEDTVTRVIDLVERWTAAGPPPIGTSMARWWDTRLVELRNAINPAPEQRRPDNPAPDDQLREQYAQELHAAERDRLLEQRGQLQHQIEQQRAAIVRVHDLADLIEHGAPWTASHQETAARLRDALDGAEQPTT
jgi:hypothetical protein